MITVKNDHYSKFSSLSNWKEEATVTGSNPVEALIFSGFFFPVALIGKFTMIILPFHLELQFINELFHIQYTSHHAMIVTSGNGNEEWK